MTEPSWPGDRRVTVRDLQAATDRGERWAMLTSYDALTAGSATLLRPGGRPRQHRRTAPGGQHRARISQPPGVGGTAAGCGGSRRRCGTPGSVARLAW